MLKDPSHVRQQTLAHLRINVVLDVGANIGDYATGLFAHGFEGRVISFEPVSKMYTKLAARAARNPRWSCRHLALGERNGTADINVAETMSSLLPKSADASNEVDFTFSSRETIEIACLDTLRPSLFNPKDRVWLKMDVQGYEMAVLQGGMATLSEISAIEVELSFVPYYSGQPLFGDMVSYLDAAGFRLWWLNPAGPERHTGRMVEADGTFVRADLADKPAAAPVREASAAVGASSTEC
jgi:FkbM family methyltransferase